MEEDEAIATYFLRVDVVVNATRGLGETVDELFIVEKIQRTFLVISDTKVSALEEINDLDKIAMDKLHGILTTYKIRIETY